MYGFGEDLELMTLLFGSRQHICRRGLAREEQNFAPRIFSAELNAKVDSRHSWHHDV